MKIGIGNDHHGVKLKNKLVKYLTKKGHTIINYGTDTNVSVDYPDYAKKVGHEVAEGTIDFGILICKTGIGMSIACNRINGARCAKLTSIKETKLAKEHNNANVMAFAATTSSYRVKDMVDMFLKTKFSADERHERRLLKVDNNEY